MAEPEPLVKAREHLSRAESDYRSEDGLFHLEEGLALLEKVALDSATEHQTIAANLLSTYSTRICESVRTLVATNPGLPEPELEHLFKVLLAFDSGDLKLPGYVRSLKIDVVKRLIDRYYEGHSAEEKQKMFQQLAGIAADRHDT
ncbi:MAG: hypothetical protein WD795_12960 [Woeseia sp.]